MRGTGQDPRLSTRLAAAAALAVGGSLGACGGENDPTPVPGLVVAKAAQSGDAQTATAGAALANPLAVVVTRDAAPAAGVSVAWSVLSGGGSLGGATSTTDASGVASTTWTLGTTAGAQTARATVSGASGSPVGFSATATAGPATSLALSGGGGQSGTTSTALPTPLQVRATDQFGNNVAGVAITWSVTSGGGSVSPPSSVTAAAGTATTVWTLGSLLGTQTAQAVAAGLTGSPVQFSAIGSAPPNPSTGVTVGNNTFTPATRTIPTGSTVTWTWVNTGATPHSVESTGSPAFTSSPTLTGSGSTYSVQFNTAGTYTYQCAVHGSAMSGTIVVN